MTLKLKFESKEQALAVLSGRFQSWTGIESPFVNANNDHLVIVKEPIELDEDLNPLPTTWVGFHVDLLLKGETTEYSEYEIEVNNPAHEFLITDAS